MKTFPETVSPKYKETFSRLRYERNICYMRREVYEHILKGNENDFFDLTTFDKKFVGSMEKTQNMWKTISSELEKLGWKTQLSYGDTGAFIYSTEKKPSACW